MKLGSSSSSSSQEAYGAGDSGRGGPGALTISSVMHDLKEKFKNDEEDQRACGVSSVWEDRRGQ